MGTFTNVFIPMSFPERFIQLRKQNKLTQQEMADLIGIHVTQIKRYEAKTAQPSLEILKKIAVAFSVTTDSLIFENDERDPKEELKLKFEAIVQMEEEDQKTVKSVLDGMILKHQAKQLIQIQVAK